jgi:hypothetical protein
MKLTIDNLDGLGALDYTGTLTAQEALEVRRQLNEPSLCSFALLCAGAAQRVPVRNARVIVTSDNGTILFTGYLPCEPTMEYAGTANGNAVYIARLVAISDELLLNQQGVLQSHGTHGQTVQAVLESLTNRVAAGSVVFADGNATVRIGSFRPAAGKSWAENAGVLASTGRAAYRIVNGTLSMQPIASTVHRLDEADGSLQVQALKAASVKMLADDVTVCGEEEPAAYVTEIFEGDGITSSFELTETPYFPSSGKKTMIEDYFQAAGVDRQLWAESDPNAQLSITAAGLTLAGGTGVDGQTNLSSIDQMELGGSLVAETSGVQLASGDGILCGIYGGAVITPNCFAGFHASSSNGGMQVAAIIAGLDAGAAFTPAAGHLYTLRVRMFSKETQRVYQSYVSVSDSETKCYGGTSIPSPVHVLLEIQDMTNGILGPVTVLYDGTTATSPATFTFAPVSSFSLVGSIRSTAVLETGPVWALGRSTDGGTATLRLGTPAEAADCRITATGKLDFYKTRVPAAGERISICYRTRNRSVARLASTSGLSMEGYSAIPAAARWIGSVVQPEARSSADCENAAQAILDLSCSRLAALEGEYVGYNMQAQSDVWPGDVLAVNSASAALDANLVVRSVKVHVMEGFPEVVKYTVRFANDWAHDLAIKTSSRVPEDAWIPTEAKAGVSALASLSELCVSCVDDSTIAVTTGVTPPVSGGFEVRRRDWSFGPGIDSDLVLRSPVASFVIPRSAAIEQYYVRMYDGATPPNYSRFSAAVFVNVTM